MTPSDVKHPRRELVRALHNRARNEAAHLERLRVAAERRAAEVANAAAAGQPPPAAPAAS